MKYFKKFIFIRIMGNRLFFEYIDFCDVFDFIYIIMIFVLILYILNCYNIN